MFEINLKIKLFFIIRFTQHPNLCDFIKIYFNNPSIYIKFLLFIINIILIYIFIFILFIQIRKSSRKEIEFLFGKKINEGNHQYVRVYRF